MVILINSLPSKGTKDVTILQYLKSNGCDVPRFCFHEKLDIAGNCRMCLVEIEGIIKPIASCTVKITDNMSIFTNTKMASLLTDAFNLFGFFRSLAFLF